MAEGQDDDARLAQIRARVEAATPGPWYVDGPHEMCGEIWVCTEKPPATQKEGTPWPDEASPEVVATGLDDSMPDAVFIAHAREDVPYLLARLDALAAEAADVARENEALIEEVRASGEQITALAAERDELRADVLRLIEVRDRAVDGADHAFAERDALAARLAAAEAALPDPGKLWSLATWLDSVYPYDSNPEVQTDLRTWAKAIVATGAHPGAWVREVVEDSAALAASSAEPSTVTTRTITIRCHCGRGVSVGADPWCEGCVQSAATCDCVPATQGRGDA